MSWLARFFGRSSKPPPSGDRQASEPQVTDADDPENADALDPEVVELPIEDSIDLHPFQPREIRDVVGAYLDEAWERGFDEVRIVHGRGIGQQRQAVRKLLERDPRVRSFADAGPERGGWGATIARFEPQPAPRDDESDPSES